MMRRRKHPSKHTMMKWIDGEDMKDDGENAKTIDRCVQITAGLALKDGESMQGKYQRVINGVTLEISVKIVGVPKFLDVID